MNSYTKHVYQQKSMWEKCAYDTSFVGSLMRTVHRHYTKVGYALSCTTRALTRCSVVGGTDSCPVSSSLFGKRGGRGRVALNIRFAVPYVWLVMGAGFPVTSQTGARVAATLRVHQASLPARSRRNVQRAVTVGLARPVGCRTTLTDGLRSKGRDERVRTRHQCRTLARLGT